MRNNFIKYAAICGLIPVLAVAEADFKDAPPPEEDMPMQAGPDRSNPDAAHGHRKSPHHRLMKLLDKLDLSDAQKKQIEALLQANETEIHGNFKAERESRAELHRLAFSADYSDDKAKALLAKTRQTHEQTMLQKARLDNAVFKLLTPEQRQKLQQRLAKKEPPPGDKPQ